MRTHIIKIVVTTPGEDGLWTVEVHDPDATRTGGWGDTRYSERLREALPDLSELSSMVKSAEEGYAS